MTLPANVATCTVTGTFVNSDGSVPAGTVEFIPQAPRMVDATATPPATILPVATRTTLDATGAISVELIATDDTDLAPTGWKYRVQVNVNGQPYGFEMAAPAATTVDLADVTPVC